MALQLDFDTAYAASRNALDLAISKLIYDTEKQLRDSDELEEDFGSFLGDVLTYHGCGVNAHWMSYFQNQFDDISRDDAERLAMECGDALDEALIDNELGRIVATDSHFSTRDDLLVLNDRQGDWEAVPLPADWVAALDQLTDDDRRDLIASYDIEHDGHHFGLGDCWTAKATHPMAVLLRVTYDDLRAYVDDNGDDDNLDMLRAWLENSFDAANA